MTVDSYTRDLLVGGIAAAKAKEAGEARFFLKWLLRLDPPTEDRIETLFWLSEICTDPAEQHGYPAHLHLPGVRRRIHPPARPGDGDLPLLPLQLRS